MPASSTAWGWLAALLLAAGVGTAAADIAFEEVTREAAIDFTGPTNGASWGDLDGDGYPDVFVANHRLEGNQVSLYLNRRDGTFEDVGASLGVAPLADLHGVAWADFDNDGDQDLMALAGGGAGEGDAEGEWSYPNQLFRNDGGRLENVAATMGLEYPQGRGRTPLWLDADGDGRLDVLLVNARRPDGSFPSALFVQRDGRFHPASAELGFTDGPRTRTDEYLNIAENLMNLRWRRRPNQVWVTDSFAQLADLHDGPGLELVSYVDPLRIYTLSSGGLDDVTNELELPNQRFVEDVAIGDFDGDARNDLFFLKTRVGRWWNRLARPGPVIQVEPHRIEGTFSTDGNTPDLQVHFRSEDPVELILHPQWVTGKAGETARPTVRIGGAVVPLTEDLRFRVTPEQAAVSSPDDQAPDGEVSLSFDRDSAMWILRSTERAVPRINFVVASATTLELVATGGYVRLDGRLPDSLVVKDGDGTSYADKPLTGRAGEATACLSVAAGDFDNDMDLDLYLVCADPVENSPNRLYENDGRGHFRLVAEAGGAPGSPLGRGDTVALADYDLDGFLDLFVTNGAGPAPFGYDGPHQLYRNRGNANHWIQIDLEGVRSNRSGIGAVVRVVAGGVTQRRDQSGGMHLYAQNHQRLHFGLGSNRRIDEIVVHWPSGTVQRLRDVEADRVLPIREPESP